MKTKNSLKGALRVESLTVSYHGVPALTDVSFALAPIGTTALLGPNGAGKTTLANALAGLVRATSGTIAVGDSDVTNWAAYARASAGIGLLPDTRAIYPDLTVTENLRMAFRHHRRAAATESIDRSMEMFPALRRRAGNRAGHLSGGEQQMLAVARFAIEPPPVLVVDELSHGLAPVIVDELFETLGRISQTSAVLLIEQFVGRALDAADRVLVLNHGSLVRDSPTSEIDFATITELYALEGSAGINP